MNAPVTARRFRLISFDLDDTLWAVAPVLQQAEQRAWDWLCSHFPRIADHFSRDDLASLRMALMQSPHLRHRVSAIRLHATAQALRRAGYLPAEAERGAHAAFEVFLTARHAVQFFEHAIDALDTLSRDYTLGVLTNGNACIQRLGLGHLFRFAFAAEHFAAGKPDPTMFRAALDAVGCSPAQMVHVGDHPDYDIAAAQALGIHTVWANIAGQPWQGEKPADIEVRNLQALPGAIAALERQAAA